MVINHVHHFNVHGNHVHRSNVHGKHHKDVHDKPVHGN